jgi:hypothetical protein
MKRKISGYTPRFDAKAEKMVLDAMNEKLGMIDEKNMWYSAGMRLR